MRRNTFLDISEFPDEITVCNDETLRKLIDVVIDYEIQQVNRLKYKNTEKREKHAEYLMVLLKHEKNNCVRLHDALYNILSNYGMECINIQTKPIEDYEWLHSEN